jgi:hypothetical protein
MLGPIINSGAIVVGSLIGATLARYIPNRLQTGLPATFALCSVAIGIGMIIKATDLTVIVMAFIIGTGIGELLYLENCVSKAAIFVQTKLDRFLPLPRGLTKEEYSLQFTTLIVIFAASGLGVIGAMTEGLNGNYQLLLVKALMDFVTATIFSITLGPSIILIAVIQLVVQVTLFLLAHSIMPLMDAGVYGNFSAIGGIILLAIGLRIAKIMHFSIVNFLPALFLVIPFTYLWRYFL